ncbi:hypothetical protein IPM65_05930 [Candidatus Roizmanbacteria bacterium]|nr:MAG: hypothetical protein IPM65_05930 [Candidatus Roizmanbacteria bacterium]
MCLNQVITFGGDIERFRQYLAYGKEFGISQISNEGIASIVIYWTDFPQYEKVERDDICIVKPFILRPELDDSQLILYEQAFRSTSPNRYLRFRNNPSELALELYSEIQ